LAPAESTRSRWGHSKRLVRNARITALPISRHTASFNETETRGRRSSPAQFGAEPLGQHSKVRGAPNMWAMSGSAPRHDERNRFPTVVTHGSDACQNCNTIKYS